MRMMMTAAVAMCTAIAAASAAQAQATLDAPMGEFQQRSLDSGVIANVEGRSSVAFSELVHTPRASWTRLHFSEVKLERGSRVRVTSLLDGEVQELDAATMEMWGNATAFFNGDTVLVELIAGPNTSENRIKMDRVRVEVLSAQQIGLCGICNTDDREPSDEDWSGRLAPGGCSAGVFNTNSCMVSAGHCMPGNNVVQFNVPNSTGNCFTQNPPVADQFPITDEIFENNGVGNDWAVFTTGTNNMGQTIYDRYGEYRPLAESPANQGQSVQVWGYGQSETCTLTHTQQLSNGIIVQRNGSTYSHTADTTGGNSGSAFLHNDEIIGVVTHCPCPNVVTRIDVSDFAAAIVDLCPTPIPNNDTCDDSTVITDGTYAFSNEGATTTGPDEGGPCDQAGETNIEADVWFGYSPTCTGELTVGVCDSDFATRLAIYPIECPTEPGTAIACTTTGCPTNTRSQLTIPVQQGVPVRFRIGGRFGATGEGVLTVSCQEVTQCPSDLNSDSTVNVSDMLQLLGEWGDCAGCDADLNDDNVVNVSDLLILLGEWGSC